MTVTTYRYLFTNLATQEVIAELPLTGVGCGGGNGGANGYGGNGGSGILVIRYTRSQVGG